MRPRTVLYHSGCLDGFTAAWVLWRRFGQGASDGPLDFVPVTYGDPPPWHLVEGRDVYVVDFSYPRPTLEEMKGKASLLLVLDHHHTAAQDLAGLSYAVFDMGRSGAGLAWDWAFMGRPRPWLVDYVEDRDLWAGRLPHSREVGIFLGGQSQTFPNWQRLCEAGLEALLPAAQACGDLVRSYAETLCEGAVRATLQVPGQAGAAWHDVPTVCVPHRLVSETLHELLVRTEEPMAAGWHQGPDGQFVYSLRGRDGFDVSEVARAFGGGGHKAAAGFRSEWLVHEVSGA